MFTKIILPALSVIVMFGAAGTVQAQDLTDLEAPSRLVRIHGSDLRSSDGVQETYARLKRTAHDVCDSAANAVLRAGQTDRACAREALNNAVADLNQPALSQLHAEKTGHAASVYADRGDERVGASK